VVPEQVPEQHSDPPLHTVPRVEHVQVVPAETPEQHWLGPATARTRAYPESPGFRGIRTSRSDTKPVRVMGSNAWR
jgi:hypothetical protein